MPIPKNSLSIDEAFGIIKTIKDSLKKGTKIMVAGGREYMFKDKQYQIFDYGANSIVIGDYLTTLGTTVSKELSTIEKLGFDISQDCH